MSESMSKFRYHRKQDLVNVLGEKCQICGFNSYLSALEFHHEKPEEKLFNLSSQENNNRNIIDCLNEARKCFLVCSNCHRGIHEGILKNPDKHIFNEELAQQLIEYATIYHGNLPQYYCQRCNKPITRGCKFCSECNRFLTRKVEHPSRDKLKMLIRNNTFPAIGRMYGVNGQSVRKWCIKENLPDTKQVINGYSDEEWQLI